MVQQIFKYLLFSGTMLGAGKTETYKTLPYLHEVYGLKGKKIIKGVITIKC